MTLCTTLALFSRSVRSPLCTRRWSLLNSTVVSQATRLQSSASKQDVTGSKPEPSPTPPSSSSVEKKLPGWAAKYAHRFKNNPASHITSFLILHEITAVLPLPILFWFFHSFDWTPESKDEACRHQGPLGRCLITRLIQTGLPTEYLEKGVKAAGKQLEKWGLKYTGDDGSRYLFEGAAAYAVVKMMLPLRIATSLSLTPLFARYVQILADSPAT